MTDTSPDPRIQPITMPKWGLSMKTGKVVDWLVSEGDEISHGQDLADIETDKIAGTLEATHEGVLRRIVAQVGSSVPVSGVIAVIAPDDVSDDAIDSVVTAAQEAAASGEVEEAAGPTVNTVGIGGHTVSYATMGTGGDVVVLVHGYGGDKNSWLFVQEPLATAGSGDSDQSSGRTVHALDLPGHGESSKRLAEDADLDSLAAVVIGFLDALGIDRAHLVGHSLGGAVVTAAAAEAPERVRSLTLLAPAGFGEDADAEYLQQFAAASSRRELKPLLGRLFADESQVTRQLVDDVLKYKRLDGVEGALRVLLRTLLDAEGKSQGIRAREILGRTQVPRAVVWGAADRILPSDAAPDPDERTDVRIVDGAGHMVHMESPQAVLEAMEKLLERS
jgi:pyruvate dehydrogenase E2 component (dihydrolipoamide acetyltransferase)